MADKTIKKGQNTLEPEEEEQDTIGPISGVIAYDDPRVDSPAPALGDEEDDDPFSFLDGSPLVDVSKTPQQISEEADRQLWFQKRAELENLAPGTSVPEEWVTEFEDPDKRLQVSDEHYEKTKFRDRQRPWWAAQPDVTGAATFEEGQERQIPSEASIQPKIEGPLAAPLSPSEWLESTPNPAHRDDRGAPTKEGLTAYYNHYRRQLLQQGLLDDKKEQEIRVKYAASMLKHFDLPDSEAEQLLNSTIRNNLSFQGEAKFVEDSLDLKEGAFGKQNETNPIARTTEQFELFNRAKREALERGKFAFATLYDAKTEQYYVGAGNFDKLSLDNRNEAIAAAYEALDAGVLDPGDLWRVKYLLSPSGMGTSTIAQAAQNFTLRQDVSDLSTAQGEALYTPKTESIDKLLLAVLNPRAENLGTWWDEDVQGNRPETLNDALQYDTHLKDSQFRGIQKRLVLQDLKKQGRDEEFEAVNKALLDSEWLEKYIPDERTHKYGVRRLRQMFRELAANHANSTSTFKFFDNPSEYYKNVRVTPMGTVLIAPQLQYRKDWFELALSQYRTKGEETLSDKQIRLLREQRDNFMLVRYEAIDRVLRETSDATAEAWNDAKQANNILSEKSPSKKSKIEVLDAFLLDPENYSAFSSQFGAILESAWDQGVRGIYHSFAVMLGSESSVQALNEINEKAADRKEIARLFGNPYGLGMEVGTQLAPMALDVTATGVLTALTGTGGAAYVLAKTGVRAGFKGHTKLLMGRMLAKEIGESSVEATQRVLATGLIKNSSDAATAEGVRKAIKAYNGLVANKLVIAGGTFGTAANRSGGGMYVSVYEALKKQNPDKSHEWLHDRSLGPALAGGFLTGLITVGMQGIGKGGMEDALLANMPWRKAKGILNSITRTGLRELPDDVAKEALVRITSKRILKVVGSKFPRLLKDMGDEGFEEALDTFLNSFIEDWATGKSSTLGERLMNSWHAFQVGALATSTVPVARAAITKVRGTDVSDPAFFEEEQISGIAKELQKELAQTGSPMTADALEELLTRPASQPRIIEGEAQLEELPEARVPRVSPEQREEHLKEVAEVLKGREPIEGEGPFLDDLPQIDDPELLELAEKDINYNVNSDGVVLGVRNINNGEWVGQEPDEDAATISRPDVPEGADPNDLRYPSTDLTGDTVTEETVKAETARWSDVNKKQLENKGIKLTPTDLNKGNPTGTNAAVVNIGSNKQGKGAPVIQLDFAGLARRLEGVDKKDRYKVFNAILGEELTHAAEIIQFKLEYKKLHDGKEPTSDELKAYANTRYEAMYADMQVQERRNVVAAYENIEDKDVILPEGATPDRKAQMTKAQIAGEFTRMLLQYESTKTTTESAQWLTSDEVSTFLGGVSDRIGKNLLHKKTGFKGPVRHNLGEHLKRVNSVLVDFVIRKAEQEGVDPDVAKAAAKEEQLIQEVQFDGHHKDGTSFSRDWWHIGNSSKKWTSQGKDRDGATMVSRDRNYKIVRKAPNPTEAHQDTYELINLETQRSEGVFDEVRNAEAKHKELTTTPDTTFDDPDIEPPKPVATTAEDQTYLDLIENQSISENAEEIQKKVFQAALNPTQIAAVEAHAKAVESGKLDAIQEARRQMGSVGLGDIPADAILNTSDPVAALSAVLESFGLNPEPIIADEAGTTLTLSERFPNETQIIPLNPESANTTDINDELRVVENARIVRDVASQWGVEVVFRVGSTTNRGDLWADEGKIFVDTNTVHETINELSDADAKKLMTAKALAQVSVALSFQEHSQNQITELSKETSTKELYNLVDEFYPDESSRAEAKKRLEGTEGDTQAGQEISFLIRQKIANETTLILQGQKVSSLEADIRNRPTFKRQVINFMGRVYTRLVSAKRRHKKNPNLSISISNLAESMKAFRGIPRGPRREKFNPDDPNKTLDTASDMLEAQAPMSDESKVDTSEFKIRKEALTHVANSDSRFAPIAQELIDSFGDDLLGYELYGIPEEASPSQILRTFLKGQLSLAGQLPEENGINPNLKGEELHVALTKMVTDARASDDPKVSKNPELDLWEVYLSLVDPKQMTRNWKSQHSFFGFLDRMLSDPWVQSNARQDTVGFTNSWDKFTKAATTLLDFKARGGFQKADVLDIIDSSLEDVDFALRASGALKSSFGNTVQESMDNFTNAARELPMISVRQGGLATGEDAPRPVTLIEGQVPLFWDENTASWEVDDLVNTWDSFTKYEEAVIEEEKRISHQTTKIKLSGKFLTPEEQEAKRKEREEKEKEAEREALEMVGMHWSEAVGEEIVLTPDHIIVNATNEEEARLIADHLPDHPSLSAPTALEIGFTLEEQEEAVAYKEAQKHRKLWEKRASDAGWLKEYRVNYFNALADDLPDTDLRASGAQRNTNKINSNRTVEILELPVFETGPYEGPGGWKPWNWKILKGHLDPRLRRLFELRRQYQRYLGAEIRQYKDTMDALIDEEFGGRENAPLELIRLATGSTQGVVLSEEVEGQINSEYEAAMDIIAESDLPKEVKEEATAKAKAKRLDRRRLEEGKAAAIIQKDIDYAKDALREQSPAIADHVESLRNMVDELSEQTSRLLGGSVGNEELKIHFDAQMGIYLTRTYKIFSEEGWMDTVLEHEDYSTARDEAVVWFENKFLEERAKSIVNTRNKKPSVKWSKLDDEAKYELALERARDELGAKEGLGEDLMKEFLRSYQSETKVVTEGQSESRADMVDSLRRKLSDDDLPPVIRKMLGEYGEDTGDFNLMRTFLNVGDLASRQAFLHGVVDMGRSGKQEDWWLLTKKEVEAQGLQDDYVTIRDMDRIPARENREGISSFDPLIDFVDEKGNKQGPLYAPKDMVDNFRAFTEPWQPSNKYVKATVQVTRFLDNLLKQPTGIAMAAMTLGSIPFYIRNVVSNVFFFGPAQGVLFVDPWVFKKAIKEVARVYTTNTERDAARMRMIKLGVLGEDLTVSVWEEMVSGRVSQTQVLAELQRGITEAAKFHSKGLDIPKKILDKLKQTAVACDAFYKIVLYQHELKHLKKAQDYAIKRDPTDALADTDLWTEAKLEEEAAKKVLMVAQSYSQAPPIVRGFTDSAMGNLVAPFFRFKMEVPRIIWNTYKLGFQEYGSDNPIIKKRGRNRVVAMSTMLGPVSAGLGQLSKWFFDITDEEEEALRENAPSWAKSQSFLYFRLPNGTPVTLNLTYVNPFAMWVDGPLRFAESLFRGDPNDGVKLGLEALLGTPFTEGQIFIKGLGGAVSGNDDYGDKFVSESDPLWEDAYKRTAYLTSKVFQPPTLKRLFGEFRPGAPRRPLIAALEENRKTPTLSPTWDSVSTYPRRAMNDIDNILRSPWGIIFTEFIPAKPRTLDSEGILNSNMGKAMREKSKADRILDGLKTLNPISQSKIQDTAERYVEAVEGYATIAMKYGSAYKKWGISDRVIRDKREQILTKAGYKKFLRDGVIKLRGLSKQDITQMKEAADEHDLPQIEERIRLFNQALENLSDEEHKGHIRLPE